MGVPLNKRLLLSVAFLALTACATSEPHQDSGIAAPSAWTRLAGLFDGDKQAIALDDKAGVEHQWWTHFGDPALDKLIAGALANNKTLGIAKARVEEARADYKGSLSALMPQVSGGADATRQNLGYLADKPVGILEANLQASWELDLFGKNQARGAAADAIVESADAERQGVMVSLLADVARNYFDLRNAERQIDITESNLANQKKTLELTRAQFEGALLSDFDVQRATAQVATTEAELPPLRTARDAALNRLSVLTGAAPGTVDDQLRNLGPLKPLDPRIVVSAPASVLAERPDIRAAERRFASTVSLKKAAVRAWLPTVSLSALFGVQDTSLLTAHPWTLATGLTQPILNFGAITSQIDAADARKQQAFLNYQQTILNALEDMENALSSYGHEAQRNASLAASAEATKKAEDLARQQFEGGDIGLLDVLVAQRDSLAAQSAQAASDSALRQDLAHIYTAAGGGWQVD